MNDVEFKRQALMVLYGRVWKMKVAAMSEDQVIAVFLRFKKEGKV